MASSVTASSKTALITGITGQDGSYLAELLLEKGYEVREEGLPGGESVKKEELSRPCHPRRVLERSDPINSGSLLFSFFLSLLPS